VREAHVDTFDRVEILWSNKQENAYVNSHVLHAACCTLPCPSPPLCLCDQGARWLQVHDTTSTLSISCAMPLMVF